MKTMSRIADLLGEILSRDAYDFSHTFRLSTENGVTPLDVAKLAIACEQTFGFPLYDEKIAQWRTLGDAARHIDELLEEGQAESTARTDEDRVGWYYE